MPKYYQIHRGIKLSQVENKFIENKPFFFSKKNSFWYNFEKDISIDFGGYIIYEIFIPNNLFTSSFNPRTKNKIVKVSKQNLNEYIKLKRNYGGHKNFINEMKNRNIIGIDATSNIFSKKHFSLQEGYLWKKYKGITIKRVNIININ